MNGVDSIAARETRRESQEVRSSLFQKAGPTSTKQSSIKTAPRQVPVFGLFLTGGNSTNGGSRQAVMTMISLRTGDHRPKS